MPTVYMEHTQEHVKECVIDALDSCVGECVNKLEKRFPEWDIDIKGEVTVKRKEEK